MCTIVIHIDLLMWFRPRLILRRVPIECGLVIFVERSRMSLLSAKERLMVSMRRQSNDSILEPDMCCQMLRAHINVGLS